MERMRLDRFFSSQEILSRRDVRGAVKHGRILVNGAAAKKPDMQIDVQKDQILLDGQAVIYEPFVYLMLNKPQGVVSATDDKIHRTVLDLVPPELFRSDLFPAGRLDKDTTGFVLLTNDGAFAHRILSPGSHVEKQYEVLIDGPLTPEQEEKIRSGAVLADGYECMPCRLTLLKAGKTPLYEIVLREGKYHQIKKMFGTVGRGVLTLKRTRIGVWFLDANLEEGHGKKIVHIEIDLILCNS